MESSAKHVRLFGIFDRNRDGYIGVTDMKKILRYVGYKNTILTKDVKDMIQDINSTCCIDKSKMKTSGINFETFTVFCYDTDPTTFVQSKATVLEMMQLKSTGSESTTSSIEYQEELLYSPSSTTPNSTSTSSPSTTTSSRTDIKKKKKPNRRKFPPSNTNIQPNKYVTSPMSPRKHTVGTNQSNTNYVYGMDVVNSPPSPSDETVVYYRSTIPSKKKNVSKNRNSASRQLRALNLHRPQPSPIKNSIAKISSWLGKEQSDRPSFSRRLKARITRKKKKKEDFGLGTASVQEIEKTARRKRLEMNTRMQQAFKTFDQDDDGYISRNDMKSMMDRMGINITHDEITSLFQLVEARDRLSYDDFILLTARASYF